MDYALPESAELTNRVILLRVDLNVPMKDGHITDDTRLKRVLPTIQHLSQRGAKILLISHFGRPKGEAVESMSLKPLQQPLQDALPNVTISFAPDCIGEAVEAGLKALQAGDIVLCENLRFHAGEESGDDTFARALSEHADLYINDAFSCSHRAHASITGVTAHLPSYFGDSMQQELAMLEKVFTAPTSPVAALVGGSKVSTKMELLENLIERMDIIMIGGGMANTFLYAQGHEVGASLCEADLAPLALSILKKAHEQQCRILLPVDVVAALTFAAHAPCQMVESDAIPDDAMALDVGIETVRAWGDAIKEANTLVWNGPAGAFEMAPFDHATVSLAQIISAETQAGRLISVAGGGDTVAALSHAGMTDNLTYVSTAGGAFLEWLEGKTLPGVAAIQQASYQKAG